MFFWEHKLKMHTPVHINFVFHTGPEFPVFWDRWNNWGNALLLTHHLIRPVWHISVRHQSLQPCVHKSYSVQHTCQWGRVWRTGGLQGAHWPMCHLIWKQCCVSLVYHCIAGLIALFSPLYSGELLSPSNSLLLQQIKSIFQWTEICLCRCVICNMLSSPLAAGHYELTS